MVHWGQKDPPTHTPSTAGWWAGANWGRTGSSERKTGCGQEELIGLHGPLSKYPAGRRLCNQKQKAETCAQIWAVDAKTCSNWQRPPGCGSRTWCSASCPDAHTGAALRVPPLTIQSLRSLSDESLPVLQIPGMEKNQVDDDNIREKVTKVTRDTGRAAVIAGGRPSENHGC